VDKGSGFCNKCGAPLRSPAPPGTAGQPRPETAGTRPAAPAAEPARPFPEKPPATPPAPAGETGRPPVSAAGAARPPAGSAGAGGPPAGKKRLLKTALVAAAVVVIIIVAAVLAGIVPGKEGPAANATPVPEAQNQTPGTTATTPAATQTTAPVATPSPAAPPATTVTATASPTVTPAASPTIAVNASANATANASVTVPATIPVTNPLVPLSVGQSAYDGKGMLTVHDFSFRDKISDPVPSYAVGRKYLIVNITYENLQQNGTVDVDLSMMRVLDGGGYPYGTVSDTHLANPWTGGSIPPGEQRSGNLLFVVPPQAMYLKLEYHVLDRVLALFQLT